MGPGKFEDSIRDKFEGQTKAAPNNIWTNIENELNAELVSMYASQQMMYKWVSVAAVIIAVLLLGVIYSPTFTKEAQTESGSYNAFLSNDIDYSNYYSYHTTEYQSRDLTFNKIESPATQKEILFVEENKPQPLYEIKGVERRNPQILASVTQKDIYRYYQAGAGLPTSKSKNVSETKMWAGVEAGAGTFNSSFGESGAVANSLNPGALASAIGSGNFVNPTTNISEEMDQGIATTIGLDFGVQLGKKWTLESGLAYTNLGNSGTASINVLDVYTIDNNDFIDTPNGIDGGGSPSFSSREATIEVEENFDHEIELNNNIQIASIPLKAGYFVVDRKFSLRLNAGLSANYLVDGNISDPSKQILNSDNLSLYNDWSFDGVGGLELGYSIFNKFDFTIEPNYRHSITPISDAINSPSRFVLQTGLRYTLK